MGDLLLIAVPLLAPLLAGFLIGKLFQSSKTRKFIMLGAATLSVLATIGCLAFFMAISRGG